MIKYTGIKNILEELDININQVYAGYSFYNPNTFNNYVYPDSWAVNSATGVLNNNTNFYNFSGSGFFDGSNYMYLSGKEFELNNSLVLLSYEKNRIGNEILLSSFRGNSFSNYSGFSLGVNSANKLYFSYWNNIEGLFTFTYSKILADKNLILLNKNGPILSIGKYNNNTFDFDIEEFNIFQNVFIESDQLYLGGSPIRNDFNHTELNFSGIIDKFFFIKSNDLFFYKESLALGLFSNINKINQQGEQYCFETGFFSGSGFFYSGNLGTFLSGYQIITTGITGYTFVSSGYSYSGITGYQKTSVGFYVDNCNFSQEVFVDIPLSGTIFINASYNKPLTGIIYQSGFVEITKSGILSGEEQVWISGIYCTNNISNISDTGTSIDLNYLPSLSFREINLLREVLSGSYIETFLEPYTGISLNYNKDLIYDILNKNYFYFDTPIKNRILLFANGQSLVESGFISIPNGYNINIDPKFDYYLTGSFIETSAFYNDNDFLFYDDIQIKNYYIITGISNNTINVNFTGNLFLFKNGQKLIENIDYEKYSNQIILTNNNSYINDMFLFVEIDDNKFNQNTQSNFINPTIEVNTKFNHGCSHVYLNGVRQKINNNYIENAKFDLISGNFYQKENLNIIYNNTDDFLT